ncbi:MAG TPA: HAD hydrolase family protein [Gammaproteobacteria bacterium]|nr:HAD hydrolase family protein [Gammaproteobacteria bacterium]
MYPAGVLDRARRVRLVAFDVDGVFTDGRLYFGRDGEALKVFDVRDGHGVKCLAEAGIATAVISGRSSPIVSVRMAELGVPHVYQGCREKLPFFESLCATLGIACEEAAYVGDDEPDLPVLRRAGLAIAVQDAHPDVAAVAHWCTRNPGGRGAVREVADLLLAARGGG